MQSKSREVFERAWIKAARVKAGYETLRSGAEAAGIRYDLYRRIEQGDKEPTAREACRIARAFHFDVYRFANERSVV